MRKRIPSPIHSHKKATLHIKQLVPFQNYMEEELAMEEVSEKLIDSSGEQFFELFKQHNKRFFTYGIFEDVYFYTDSFSTMFLFFNDSFYATYQPSVYYALPSSLTGLSSYLEKEKYPNETEYLKTVAYLNHLINFKEGSTLVEFIF